MLWFFDPWHALILYHRKTKPFFHSDGTSSDSSLRRSSLLSNIKMHFLGEFQMDCVVSSTGKNVHHNTFQHKTYTMETQWIALIATTINWEIRIVCNCIAIYLFLHIISWLFFAVGNLKQVIAISASSTSCERINSSKSSHVKHTRHFLPAPSANPQHVTHHTRHGPRAARTSQ